MNRKTPAGVSVVQYCSLNVTKTANRSLQLGRFVFHCSARDTLQRIFLLSIFKLFIHRLRLIKKLKATILKGIITWFVMEKMLLKLKRSKVGEPGNSRQCFDGEILFFDFVKFQSSVVSERNYQSVHDHKNHPITHISRPSDNCLDLFLA